MGAQCNQRRYMISLQSFRHRYASVPKGAGDILSTELGIVPTPRAIARIRPETLTASLIPRRLAIPVLVAENLRIDQLKTAHVS